MTQSASAILMIRPANFGFNVETELSNAFQSKKVSDYNIVKEKAKQEFQSAVETLRSKNINVIVIEDTESPVKPDAVFPNNWISFHPDGTIVLYPMLAPNRRLERRLDIIENLKKSFQVNKIVDLSFHENENHFLEGTGSIVFDHQNKIAYACLSARTDKTLLENTSKQLGYKPISFTATDKNSQEIYHTNVMMCVAEKFAVVCLESIKNKTEKEQVLNTLLETNHEVVAISLEQMNQFAGNMLEINSTEGKKYLAMSQSAFNAISSSQKKTMEKYCELLPLNINTIETIGGGSVRCMMAEIFLEKKS